jgi:hypothetical protein
VDSVVYVQPLHVLPLEEDGAEETPFGL